VKEKPAFIKPNEDEIAQLTGRAFSSRQETVRALMDLHEDGIPYVVLSLGAEGALLACDKGVFHGKPPKITPRNTVGCGDSMVAGFAVGFARHLSMAETFRMALAVSAASALSLFTGDFDPADYGRLYPEVSIDKVL
jgi:tagatose 6-phosphate kinase